MPDMDDAVAIADTGAATPEVKVRARNLKKTFRRSNGELVRAVDDVSVAVEAGKMLILLGPSGCGKTTLLRCIAGLERPDEGEIWANDRLMFSKSPAVNAPPESRGLAMMFQSYAVWPHMTVAENVAFPLVSRGYPKREIPAKVAAALKRVGIPSLGDQYPNRLSGGQQQRVALARSLVVDPQVVLFDEPLSNVDAKVREDLRVELVAQQREVGFAGIYVTHDQVEALQLADQVAVLREGRIEQLGTPEDVYCRPATRYVANFVGRVNEVEATITMGSGNDNLAAADTPLGRLRGYPMAPDLTPGTKVMALFRPECVEISDKGASHNALTGSLLRTQFSGAHRDHLLTTDDGHRLLVSEMGRFAGKTFSPGDRLTLVVDSKSVLFYPL
ncbi:ABC transporter ATP-binding protein [Agaricicola taiwanensis]|nr:ABC transporter ATP-binding protein [Agaricicola taiwanensis]